jgi:hypothetical protein
VVAVSGPRGPEWDRLLPAQDLILLASGPQVPELLATVALAGSRGLAPDVPALAVAVRGGRRRRPARGGIAAALAALEAG